MMNRCLALSVACLILLKSVETCCAIAEGEENVPLKVGVATVDISPTHFPAIIAGGFLEGQAKQLQDPLYARCFVIDNGKTRLAFAIVDSCMMPQSLIDEAKRSASQQCGIPIDHMMVSATHTHSAPAAMGCLGTRPDKEYIATLPDKIAKGIVAADANRVPARIGWGAIQDWEDTHNRRWIRKPEKKIVDPFGQATGLAHMHPGYLSPDVIGPSGPVDPTLSVIAMQTNDGQPLGVFANYSQHYFGASPVSADYYGYFCKYVAELLGVKGEGNGPFVCAMSQGTSGDCMWMDYGAPKTDLTVQRYAERVARNAAKILQNIEYRDWVELNIVEKKVQLQYRTPSEERLAWARPIAARIANDVPKDRTEVYAQEALILHERKQTELKLQAIRIGDLTMATLPNEVFALTGLKLRSRGPSPAHFNIELANGAEGYIPPPEQHALGGYTTWPARTAGLEEQAEPKIVEALLEGLEEVTGKSRRKESLEHGPYARAILEAKPISYWRMEEMDGNEVHNTVPHGPQGKLLPGFAFFLPGVGSGSGLGKEETLTPSPFSGPHQINRSIHFAGGEMRSEHKNLSDHYSSLVWLWLGERSGASDREGEVIQGPFGERLVCKQDKEHRVRFSLQGKETSFLGNANEWHGVMLTRKGSQLRLYVDGREVLEVLHPSEGKAKGELRWGAGLQGKLDEIALFDRALEKEDAERWWKLASVTSTPVPSSIGSSDAPRPASDPIEPKDSIAKIHVPKGYRVELVASEPNVTDPVAFDWDDRGRLWVVEMVDYPLGMDGKGAAGGRVRVLEDADSDGYFERGRIFAEGLSFPNGILVWRDGILVTAAPEILFLRDRDGDGRADDREVLYSGFQQGNQQLRLNGLRWGNDGWIYCANGGHHANYGKETRVTSLRTGAKIDLGSRDFRIRPEDGAIEPESGPSQFGRNRDAWGRWFGTQNAAPLWHYVMAERYATRNPYVPTVTSLRHIVGPGSPVVFPASPLEKRYHSFEQSGRFTSACSGMIYGDRMLFDDRSMHAFTCEPFHNLIQHNVLEDLGISFRAHRWEGEGKTDFFASEDRWCRPVMARTGPDGALWIADMYRYMIEHPEWLPANGKEELLPHYRLGDDRGRIYRVVKEGAEVPWPRGLLEGGPQQIAERMDSPNDVHRDRIQQYVLWKSDRDWIPHLTRLARSAHHPAARVQALWTLHRLKGPTNDILVSSLGDPDPRVRVNALQVAEESQQDEVIQRACQLAKDDDSKVRMQFALSAGFWRDRPSVAEGLLQVAQRDSADPMVVAAVMSSAVPYVSQLLPAMLEDAKLSELYFEPLLRMAIKREDAMSLEKMVATSISSRSIDSIDAMSKLIQRIDRCGSSWDKIVEMSGPWKDRSGIENGMQVLQQALKIISDESQTVDRKVMAATLLSLVKEHRSAAIDALSSWLLPQTPYDSQLAILSSLRASGDPKVPSILARAWNELGPSLRDQALDTWLSRQPWTIDLLDRLSSHEIPAGNIDPTKRDRLVRHPNKEIAKRASSLFESTSSPSRRSVLDEHRSVLALAADAGRGKMVFKRACAACHRRDEEGIDVGPNLASVVSHAPERLLISILDPNADILPGFQRYTCLLDSGIVLTGLLTSETGTSITMKLADGNLHSIPRSEIVSLQNSNASLMPEELEKLMTPKEMADVIAYLRTPIEASAKGEASSSKKSLAGGPSPAEQIEKMIAAVGGKERLLKRFKVKERLAVSSDPNAKGSERVSTIDLPGHWWLGKKDRVVEEKEPAIFLVAAWTLQLFLDERSVLESIPDIEQEGRAAYGIRVRGSVDPPMDCYLDRMSHRLVRIDWRTDKHLFSEWREVDGVAYPAKCSGYKRKDDKLWYHTEILELERQ